ncbi:MAG: hypothetical protein RMI94_07305 [Bryobacterales bacterium]|nr:hypothetical protein [Bryobacteraceae bacterium]MDW8130340.1 hypothetical protein [Bryobacterales bacterium]
MRYYRVELALESPLSTPLHSGTLFGHLCWAWRERHGEPRLAAWLETLRHAPFLISDGFPSGWLPRPLLEPGPSGGPPADPAQRVQFLQEAKRRKQARWIRCSDFLRLRSAFDARELATAEADPPKLEKVSSPHNRIDRRTGQTLEEGGLFYLEESWPEREATLFDVYVGTELDASQLRELFAHVGACGYGRDATWGRGRFRVLAVEQEDALFAPVGTRRMSLSHGSLTANMLDARYRTETHLGRLGNLFARCDKPFKYPLLLLQPGATFRPADDGPFGALLDDVHPSPPGGVRIYHNAWHLTVGYSEASTQ